MKRAIDWTLWLSIAVFLYLCFDLDQQYNILWNIVYSVEPWWFQLCKL